VMWQAAAVLLLLSYDTVSARTQRTSRDWSKMSDKDWDRIEKEWETPEEEEEYAFKPPQKKGLDMNAINKAQGNPKKMQELVAESQVSSGPAMMFATVDYEGCCEVKSKTEELASKWAAMLHSSGMDATPYVIENDMILFSTQAGLHAREIMEFALAQPECVAVEWNQQRTPGPAETEEWKAKDAIKKAKKDEQNAANKKQKEAEERTTKKKKKAKRKKEKTEL